MQDSPGPPWQRAHDALHATLAHTRSLDLRRRVWARSGIGGAAGDAAGPAPPVAPRAPDDPVPG
jgi:hypothetical protein